jgi:hypothetical protein
VNARDLKFPSLPAYTADWHALRFEPMRGTGESFTCAILIKDADGVDVKPVIRDDILNALFGGHAAHVQNMINIATNSLKSFSAQNDPAHWASPLTGFYLAENRAGASLTGRSGVLRQAIKLSSGFAQLDYSPQEIDERPALEAAKSFIGRVRQQVAEIQNDLDMYFNKPAMIVPNGSLVTFGFLMNKRAAHFEMLRPSTLSTSIKFARGKLYELKKARIIAPLERAALIIGIPHKDDLAFSDRQHYAIERELNELQQEAREDETDTLPAENAMQAAQHIIDLVT